MKKINGTAIKWIAIVVMIIDHIAWAFFREGSMEGMFMHTFGKITAPVMCFFIAEGYHYTHNLKKYIERLAVFAIISHFPFNIGMNDGERLSFLPTSVIFTLLCGLLALIVHDRVSNLFLRWIIIVALAAVTYYADWGIYGVLFVIAFGLFYGKPVLQWSAFFAVCALHVAETVYYHGSNYRFLVPVIASPIMVFILLQVLYDGTRGGNKYTKWAFYIIYPLQFVLIGIACLFLPHN